MPSFGVVIAVTGEPSFTLSAGIVAVVSSFGMFGTTSGLFEVQEPSSFFTNSTGFSSPVTGSVTLTVTLSP
ncbi:hypothetical protein, partial [Moraxella marmotae]|uniref:hypothetical protein n=1 Tax=Moraxella marmotae TaxID=3344520 RepID=UPI0035F2AC6E